MKIVRDFESLEGLPLPDDIAQALKTHLIKPHDSEQAFIDLWQELPVTLMLLEDADTDKSLSEEPQDSQYLLDFVMKYPEYVAILEGCKSSQSYVIALTITTDEGGGMYLLAPANHRTTLVQTLLLQL